MVRQEDLWSALPLLLNHLRGDSASQQVFHRYGMKNTWLYVTLSLCVSVSAIFLERIHRELNLTREDTDDTYYLCFFVIFAFLTHAYNKAIFWVMSCGCIILHRRHRSALKAQCFSGLCISVPYQRLHKRYTKLTSLCHLVLQVSLGYPHSRQLISFSIYNNRKIWMKQKIKLRIK